MMNRNGFKLDPYSLEHLAEVACPFCHATLNVHCPDRTMPETLLGACEDCKSWFVMDGDSGAMWLLPACLRTAGPNVRGCCRNAEPIA
jgi:hypothetical protein